MSKDIQANNRLAIFEDVEIRRILVGEEWYYSVVDVIKVLTDSSNPRNYWSTLKKRELDNGIELSTNCVQLKLVATDRKKRPTDSPEIQREIIQDSTSENKELED